MENPSATQRRERAVEAARAFGATYGIRSDAPAILKDSNNTVVHLAPAPVVAKVSTSLLRKQHASNLEHELNVALHLAGRGAPIVPPSGELPPAVYRDGDLEVTFWQYCPGEVREEIDRPELVTALHEFHAAFASYQGELKSFTEKYEECYSLLDGDRLSPELSAADRQFLRRVYGRLRAELETFDYECVPAHEEVHGGNIIWVGTRPLLIDFESCCLAPREIDFLPFSEKNLSALPGLDRRLMRTLGALKSFCVAMWCWSDPDRAPEVREAAEYHLGRLRGLN
jgi:Ser/Thr protein kinase RdoA (MazF antagonist)